MNSLGQRAIGDIDDRARNEARLAWWIAFGVVWFALALQAMVLARFTLAHPIDDAAFFFRYAENLAHGLGYRFNPTEPPVWGATAPLWPLVLATGVRAGLTMEQSAGFFSWMFTLSAVGLLTFLVLRMRGIVAGLAFACIAALDTRMIYWDVSGMETPLGYAIVALGLAAIGQRRLGASLGVAVGLALVHKIDFIPFAMLLVAAAWFEGGRLPRRALAVAALIAIAWYGFAWLHFGSVVPNSVLVKVFTRHAPLPATWFVDRAFVPGTGPVLVLLAVFGIPDLWRTQRGVLLCALGFILVHCVVYSLAPASEDWAWYAAPLQPCLCLLAAVGAAYAFERLAAWPALRARARWIRFGVPGGLVAAVLAVPLTREALTFKYPPSSDIVESTRVASGRWIDSHAPPDWKVLSHSGNPLYYARRYSIDSTNLNRKEHVGEEQLRSTYDPEVVVKTQSEFSAPRAAYVAHPRFRVARIFARHDARVDAYTVVEIRGDLPRLIGEDGGADVEFY